MSQRQASKQRTIGRTLFANWFLFCAPFLAFAFATHAGDEGAPANTSGRAGIYTDLVYIGSGTKDIHIYKMNLANGQLTEAAPAVFIAHPSFLTLTPDHRFLYAVTEGGSKSSSAVSAYSIDRPSGKLTFINKQPSGGSGPCHVAVDQRGKALLAANYGSGSMAVFPIKEGGALGERSGFFQGQGSSVNADRQAGPHAHCVVTDPGDRFALLCDLGLDKVFVFKFDAASASITPNDPPFASVKAGSGPRHITFHPNGRFAYLINEMGNTLIAFDYDASAGALRQLQSVSTLPADYTAANTTAEVVVHPSGNFVYGSNRGHNSIVEFNVDAGTGRLTLVGWTPTQGKTPRNFEIDPTGTYLLAANQDSNTVVVFRIDANTGALTPAGQTIEVENPMCVKFCPL